MPANSMLSSLAMLQELDWLPVMACGMWHYLTLNTSGHRQTPDATQFWRLVFYRDDTLPGMA